MAFFSITSLTISMTAPPGQYAGTRADIARIPADADATISFAHEYVHFLQSLSSVMAFRMFAELVDLGIKGALVLEGVVPASGGTVLDRTYRIGPILERQADHAGLAVPEIAERVRTIADEFDILFADREWNYGGNSGPGELDAVRLRSGTYEDEFVGVITPRRTFRPLNLRMLTEGMARRVDRWLNQNHGFGHVWRFSPQDQLVEDEVYNGIHALLSERRFAHNIHPTALDRVTVIVCALALATTRPDHAVRSMLARLAHAGDAGLFPVTIGHELSKVLIRENLLTAASYNEVMQGLVRGESSAAMEKREFYDIYQQLGRIQLAANYALTRPDYFANSDMTWATIRSWMTAHSVPHVTAMDGDVPEIDTVRCGNEALTFLRQVERVFL